MVARAGTETDLTDPTNGNVLATASAQGLDRKAALSYARERGGPALRALGYAERAKLLGAITITRPLVEKWVDDIVTVAEDDVGEAMVLLMERTKLYVEGAGAVGVAALLTGRVKAIPTGRTAVVLTGNNVDLGVLPGLVRRKRRRRGGASSCSPGSATSPADWLVC